MPANESTPRRIMIALDPSSPAHIGLELVRCLTDRYDRQLLGLAIEDGELLAHARSRLATEIVFSGAARPLESGRLELQLRAQSASVRRTFESEATRLGFSYAFKILRGSIAAALQAEANGAELLVIELPMAAASHSATWRARIEQLAVIEFPAVLFARSGSAERGAVVALVDKAEEIGTTVGIAAELARGGRLALTVLLGEQSGANEQHIVAALRATAHELPVRLQSLAPGELAVTSLAHLAQLNDARILVAPAGLARSDPRFVGRLLRATSCSLLLVNPAAQGRHS